MIFYPACLNREHGSVIEVQPIFFQQVESGDGNVPASRSGKKRTANIGRVTDIGSLLFGELNDE